MKTIRAWVLAALFVVVHTSYGHCSTADKSIADRALHAPQYSSVGLTISNSAAANRGTATVAQEKQNSKMENLSEKDILLLVLGTTFGISGSIFVNIVSGPVLSGFTSYNTIKMLHFLLWFLRDVGFKGVWRIEWQTKSSRFSSNNEDSTRIYSVAIWIAFSCIFLSDGERIRYKFVGRNRGGKISGRWFDVRGDDGYHGQFQVVRYGNLQLAKGAWLGFSSEGGVSTDILQWTKILDQPQLPPN